MRRSALMNRWPYMGSIDIQLAENGYIITIMKPEPLKKQDESMLAVEDPDLIFRDSQVTIPKVFIAKNYEEMIDILSKNRLEIPAEVKK